MVQQYDEYSLRWRPMLNKLMLLLLAGAAVFAIGYFLYQMPKPVRPQPTPSGQAAIHYK